MESDMRSKHIYNLPIGSRLLTILISFLISFCLFSAWARGVPEMHSNQEINLPETIDGWKMEGPPQRIDHTTIFDYMDGGGELYLAYKFKSLLVYRYNREPEEEMLVEIYQMETPDETFGLLSLDWTGEPVDLSSAPAVRSENPVCPDYTALYGEGLLRARADSLYLRILASRETPDVRETILKLGKILAGKSPAQPPPAILDVVVPSTDSAWKIRQDRTAYFHSHLVLNSLYYLSHENILNLNHSTEGLLICFEKKERQSGSQPAKLIVIHYPEAPAALAALTSFFQSYLPEKADQVDLSPGLLKTGSTRVEDGWLGWTLFGNYLAFAFECPDQKAVTDIFSQLNFKTIKST